MAQVTVRRIKIPQQKPTQEETFVYSENDYTALQTKMYRVILKQDEDGRFIATCPDLQGVVTDGADEEEAMLNVRDAIEAMLEARGLPNKEFNLTPIITF